MDDTDVMDHEELQDVGDVEEGQVEGDEHLQYLHQESHPKVGDWAQKDPPENTKKKNTGEKLAGLDADIVNIRFYLIIINKEDFR